MQVTAHAQARMQQRSVRGPSDLALFAEFGTEFDDGVVFLDKDIEEAIFSMREQIRRLEKLRGKAVIMNGDMILTTYSPSKKRMKKFLRKSSPSHSSRHVG